MNETRANSPPRATALGLGSNSVSNSVSGSGAGSGAGPSTFTIGARLRSFVYAARGLRTMLASQHNAWIHAAATLVAVGAGIGFEVSRVEWLVLLLAIVAVWTAESLNTAFEFLCDVASPEFHPLVEKAKDVAAGAVLICALGAAGCGALIFVPRVLAAFGGG